MKKLVIAASGHPRTNNDLVHLQEAIMEVASALGSMCVDTAGSPVLLAGGEFVPAGGSLFTVNPAWWFIAGEVYYMPGVGAALDPPEILRISSTFAANNPYLGKNIHNIRQVDALTGATPAVGDVDFLTAISNRAVDNMALKSVTKGWKPVNAAGSAFYPQFAAGIVNVSGHNVLYRKIGSGKYEFKGKANVGAYTGSSLGGYSFINFGAGLVTTNYPQHGCVSAYLNGGNNHKPCAYVVSNSGVLIAHDSAYSLVTNDVLCASAISFYEVY